jgi:SlyX protein
MTDDNTAIETALAHHDRQIQDLEEIVRRQWDDIDRLRRLVEKLQGALEAGRDDTPGEPASVAEIAAANRPPHY